MTTSDKRTNSRRRILKAAKIGFNRGSVIDCTMRNISDHGACLKVASPLGIPEFFDLIFDDGTIRPCCVKWRTATQIGVEFQ